MKYRLEPFDMAKAKEGNLVVTRNGIIAKLVDYNFPARTEGYGACYVIAGTIDADMSESTSRTEKGYLIWCADGRYFEHSRTHEWDLFMGIPLAPVLTKIESEDLLPKPSSFSLGFINPNYNDANKANAIKTIYRDLLDNNPTAVLDYLQAKGLVE